MRWRQWKQPAAPILNEHIVNEYREVISRPKFYFTEEITHDVLSGITSKGIYVDAQHLDVELPDPKDRVLIDIILSGSD